jgi:hypothetical protein
MEHPTMAHVYLFIVRRLIREQMIAKTDNPLLRDFALEYDEGLRASERMSKFAPSINKLKPFVRPIIRTIFNQTANLPLVELMNDAIVIVDLDKGKIGDVNAALIGSAILNHIGIYAFRRPATNREEFTVIVDEFQNFSHGINWTTFWHPHRSTTFRSPSSIAARTASSISAIFVALSAFVVNLWQARPLTRSARRFGPEHGAAIYSR